MPQVHPLRQWHGIQGHHYGPGTETVRNLKNIFSTLPPTKQWQIRGVSQIPETNFEEAL